MKIGNRIRKFQCSGIGERVITVVQNKKIVVQKSQVFLEEIIVV